MAVAREVSVQLMVNGAPRTATVPARTLLVHFLRDELRLTGPPGAGRDGAVQGDSALHPVQQAFQDEHALQCGYCTPGMVMAVRQLIADHPSPTEDEVRHALSGNICRCTGYQNIVAAVLRAANLEG